VVKRGRGRPKGLIRRGQIIEAVCQEYRADYLKHRAILDDISRQTGLKITNKPRMHKQIIGVVGDRFGVGKERMKQISKSGPATVSRAIKRLTRHRKPDTE
jgi:hypothetical protein